MTNFAFKWLFSTNTKDIGTLYFFFGAFSGVIGTLFSVIMRMELVSPEDPILNGNFQFYNVLVVSQAICWLIFVICIIMGIAAAFKCIKEIIDFGFFSLILKDPFCHLILIFFLFGLILINSVLTVKKISLESLFAIFFLAMFVILRVKISRFLKKSEFLKFYLYLLLIYLESIIALTSPFYFTKFFLFWSLYMLLFFKVSQYLPNDTKQVSYHLEKDFFVFKNISTINSSFFQAYLVATIFGAMYDLTFFGHFLLVLLISSSTLEFLITVGIINFCNVKSTFPVYSTCITCLKLTIPMGLALALNSTLGVWEPLPHPFRDNMQRGLLGYTAKSKSALLAAHTHSLVIGGSVPLELGTDHVDEKLARSAVETKIRAVGSQAIYGKWLGESVPDTRTSEIKESKDKV